MRKQLQDKLTKYLDGPVAPMFNDCFRNTERLHQLRTLAIDIVNGDDSYTGNFSKCYQLDDVLVDWHEHMHAELPSTNDVNEALLKNGALAQEVLHRALVDVAIYELDTMGAFDDE